MGSHARSAIGRWSMLSPPTMIASAVLACIAMALDVFPPYPAPLAIAERVSEITFTKKKDIHGEQ